MVKRQRTKSKFKKIVSEQYPISPQRGGGLVKIEVWINPKREVVKYSMAYINPLIYGGDNGRVLGYDNTHNFHHKHYFGEISEIVDFVTYENLLERFENELKEFVK